MKPPIKDTHSGGVVSVNFQAGGWGAVPRALLEDERLSHDTRWLAAWFCMQHPGWQIVVSLLCKKHGLGKDRWQRMAGELVAAGYLVRIKMPSGPGGRWCWEIVFSPTPDMTKVQSTVAGSPGDGLAVAGSAVAAQGGHIQKKEERTKHISTTTHAVSRVGSSGDSDLIFDDSIQHLAPALKGLLAGVDQSLGQDLIDELAGCMQPASGAIIKNPIGWIRGVIAKAKRGEFKAARALDVQRKRRAAALAARQRAAQEQNNRSVTDPSAPGARSVGDGLLASAVARRQAAEAGPHAARED